MKKRNNELIVKEKYAPVTLRGRSLPVVALNGLYIGISNPKDV
jgi:hypothetical protein